MDADEARPDPLGDAPPESPEDATPYAEEDESGTPLTHSELVAAALESLADHHAQYLRHARGEGDRPAQVAAIDFWTELHATIRSEVRGRPRLAPGAWLDALALYLALMLAGSEAPAPTA